MPRQADLPPDLKRLAVHNGLIIRNESFRENMFFLMRDHLRLSRLCRSRRSRPWRIPPRSLPFCHPSHSPGSSATSWIWVGVVIILLPLNFGFGGSARLAATLILATLVPVAWPFARNTILIAQIATVIALIALLGPDYQGITSGNGPVVSVLGIRQWRCHYCQSDGGPQGVPGIMV